MALEWITGNNLPQFWKNYLHYFDRNDKPLQKRYVVFDMETSGLDYKEDVIFSVGAVGITGNAIQANDFMEVHVKHDKFNTQSVALMGLLKQHSHEKVVEAEAVIRFLNFIKDATLVSHNVNLDIELLNQALKRLDLGKIKNPVMDTNILYQKLEDYPENHTVSLDELCEAMHVRKSDRHTVAGNAYITALIFLKLKKKLSI